MYNIIWYEGDGVCEGSLYSGSTSVSHTEGQGFDSLTLHTDHIIVLHQAKPDNTQRPLFDMPHCMEASHVDITTEHVLGLHYCNIPSMHQV